MYVHVYSVNARHDVASTQLNYVAFCLDDPATPLLLFWRKGAAPCEVLTRRLKLWVQSCPVASKPLGSRFLFSTGKAFMSTYWGFGKGCSGQHSDKVS